MHARHAWRREHGAVAMSLEPDTTPRNRNRNGKLPVAKARPEPEKDVVFGPPPAHMNFPAPASMDPAVRPAIHRANVTNRKIGHRMYVPDLGFEYYLKTLREKPRSWLVEQVEGGSLVRNIEAGVVSENFVLALRKAYGEAKPRTPSPVRRICA